MKRKPPTSWSFEGRVESFLDNPLFTNSHYVEVPMDIVESFEGNFPRFIVTANQKVSWPAAFMSMGMGRKFFILNQKNMKALHLMLGSPVRIDLKIDESEFGMPMPEELQEVLNQDDEGRAYFLKLTPGKQRNIIYYVGQAKSVQVRINRAIMFMERLKSTGGTLR